MRKEERIMPKSSRRTFLKQTLAITGTCLPFSGRVAASESGEAALPIAPIKDSMQRVSTCCLAWLNPDESHRPTGGYEVAHDTGRWWDAMLRYEAVGGVSPRPAGRIPADAEKAMLENLRVMTDNPAALLMNVFAPPESQVVNLHNIRETMLTYAALVKHRKDDWAHIQGRKLVSAIDGLLNPDGQLDYDRLKALMGGKAINPDPMMCPHAPAGEWFDSTGTTGRAIEAMLCFAEATGDDQALTLAKRLAEAHLRMIVDPSGKVRAELLDANHVGHNHSYCGTLRGLLLYGLTAHEPQYVDAVAKTYRDGLWGTTISHSGWTPHDLGKLRFPNEDGDPVGEHGSCADVLLLALWLGLRAGQTDLLDDAERLIRARLLPSQMTDPGNPRNDGAWGVYGHPFGYGSILDVFAAVLHALVDVDAHTVSALPDGTCSVNLHFTCDTPLASVVAKRGEAATVAVTPRRDGPLRVRVPAWAPRDSVRMTANNTALTPRWDGSYVTLEATDVPVGHAVVLEYGLPEKKTTEQMPVSKRTFTLSWRGDQVIACDPAVPIYSQQV